MPCEAMLLSCIDPRMAAVMLGYMKDRGLAKRYSHIALAGGCLGVIALPSWQEVFFDNLAMSIESHGISRLIVINHRDCGALRAAYEAGRVPTQDKEKDIHKRALRAFRKQVLRRCPELAFEGLLMDATGHFDVLVHEESDAPRLTRVLGGPLDPVSGIRISLDQA